MNIYVKKKNISSETAETVNFHFFHSTSIESTSCNSNQSSYPTGIENTTFIEANVLSMPCMSSFGFIPLIISVKKILAHLNRSLIGELIVYPWSGVRRRPRTSSTILKHLLLRNRLADQSQILCGASLVRGNEILFATSGSHDQDGRHAHVC